MKTESMPATFNGGPRNMHEKQADAMAKVRRFGRPSLFITFATNPEWKEIVDNLSNNQTPKDRPDLVGRVFCMKYKLMMKMKIYGKIFGDVIGHELSIEYQKRCLPHAHILIWLKNPIRPGDIDKFFVRKFLIKKLILYFTILL